MLGMRSGIVKVLIRKYGAFISSISPAPRLIIGTDNFSPLSDKLHSFCACARTSWSSPYSAKQDCVVNKRQKAQDDEQEGMGGREGKTLRSVMPFSALQGYKPPPTT